MNCEYCGAVLKELFTSTYCPDCDSDEIEDEKLDGPLLGFVSFTEEGILAPHNIYPASKEVVSYIDTIVNYCVKNGYKVVSSSNGPNTEHKLTSPSGFTNRFNIIEGQTVKWECE